MRRTAEHARLRPSVTSGRARGGLVTARGLMRSTLTIVALSGLIGCTGNPDPDPTPAPGINTPSASPSAAPTESGPADTEVEKPKRPAAMDREDADGAAAAAEYFLSLRSYMMATGDIMDWRSLSYKTCQFCSEDLKQAEQIQERRDRFTGGRIDAEVLKVYDPDPLTGILPMDVRMKESSTHIFDSQGKEIFSAPESVETNRVEMAFEGDTWLVIEIASIPKDS